MNTFCIPLEDDACSGIQKQDHNSVPTKQHSRDSDRNSDDDKNNNNHRFHDDVMSVKLRSNFEALRELSSLEKREEWNLSTKRKEKVGDDNDNDDDDDVKDVDVMHQAKKYRLAVETALAVEDEISRLRNGIAELESLLSFQHHQQHYHHHHHHDLNMKFPSLPPIVILEDDADTGGS
jgi:hypothetical protein